MDVAATQCPPRNTLMTAADGPDTPLTLTLTVNGSIAQAYRERYGVPVEVVRNIPMARELGPLPSRKELDLPEDRFIHCASELEAVDWALAWAQPGDLLLLLAHDKRDEVLERLEAHAAR